MHFNCYTSLHTFPLENSKTHGEPVQQDRSNRMDHLKTEYICRSCPMQKQGELTTLLQQVFLPGKDKTSEYSSLSLPKLILFHTQQVNVTILPPKHLFGMCSHEVLIRNIYSNINPEIFNISYSLIHPNKNCLFGFLLL